jgi:hypothetical protein
LTAIRRRALAKALLQTCGFRKDDLDAILRQADAAGRSCLVANTPIHNQSPTPVSPHDPVAAELRAADLIETLRDAADFAQATPAPPSGSVPHPAPPNDPLPSELRAKNLLRVLSDASDYATANSPEESERALKLYLAVLPQLSRQATSALDPQLMREYDAAMNSHDTGRAVNLLSSAFRPYVTKQ